MKEVIGYCHKNEQLAQGKPWMGGKRERAYKEFRQDYWYGEGVSQDVCFRCVGQTNQEGSTSDDLERTIQQIRWE